MSIKDEIKALLARKDFDQLVELSKQEKSVVKHLISLLYSEDDLLHWRAADALGAIARDPVALSPDKADSIINRLFVNLEDQSGGNGWGALEAIGAIIAARPNQLQGYIPKLFSHISDSRLWQGLLWSARRIGEQRPDLLKDKLFYVVGLLRHPSNTARGHAAWALGAIGDVDVRVFENLIVDVRETLEALEDDTHRIHIYEGGEIREVTVGELARDSLAAINGRRMKHSGRIGQSSAQQAAVYSDYSI